jgi:chromosomal replication initiator protein
VQFLAGRERTQEEFFHTFNTLHADRHQIVLTSDKLPREIPGLEARLRNRFASGLIAEIAPPDLETRVAILKKKAAHENLALPRELVLYIAQNVSSSVRELEGCLYAARCTLFDTLLSDDSRVHTPGASRSNPGPRSAARHREYSKDGLRFFSHSFGRTQVETTLPVAFCRQVAMYISRKLTDKSFPVIGEHFGRDHSNVIHAYNLIQQRVTNDSGFRMSIEKIERELKVNQRAA